MAKRSSLESLTVADLHRELRKRERSQGRIVKSLMSKREKLAAKLAELDSEIARHGGSVRSGRRGGSRPRNDTNLADALLAVLTGATMGVTEVAEAVKKAGYKTSSPNFRTIVNQTLINSGKFKRVGRGLYTSK